MDAPKVSLTRYAASPGSLLTAVEACGGAAVLEAVDPSDRVVIKPNLVGADDPYPVAPYGVYTTSRLVEDMVILLRDAGAGRICVAEGSVRFTPDDPGTPKMFDRLGYDRLTERYGVELIDLNDGPFATRELDGHSLAFARPALEADLLINMPVLKTHNQTKLSAGLKNLKGCLDVRSRKRCHGRGLRSGVPLDSLLARLVDELPRGLSVVDGIYALERGPFALGRAHRFDALVASTDPLAADLVAAGLLGLDPASVTHLAMAAERPERTPALVDLELVGEELASLARPLAWDFDWQTDPAAAGPPQWRSLGITGLSMPKYDASLCTGCSVIYNPLVLMLTKAAAGRDMGRLQVLTGKRMRPAPGFDRSLLVGDCIIARNSGDPAAGTAIEVPGCPPPLADLVEALKRLGLDPDLDVVLAYRHRLAERYAFDPAFDPDLFYLRPERCPAWLRADE